jgi:two-component system nitrate/nitrite response regulator NarL
MPATPSRTSVIVADDHPVYRSGLVRAIERRPDLVVLDELADGIAAVESIARHTPDVAVLDIRMPDLDGFGVVRALRARALQTPVLLLSGSEAPDSLYLGLAAGASGYLLKTAEPEDICDAIVAIGRGQVLFSSELAVELAQDIRAREKDEGRPFLSPREEEVLRLTSAGRSAAEIAGDLFLSVPTVRTHLQTAYQKLDVSDRAAAVAKALRLGLID